MEVEPTEQQQAVIEFDRDLVVTACPGSGKTYVVSEKIRNIVPSLEPHQGVIAISYTNKASDELKARSKRDAINVRASFFGTIDRFCASEIIIPFLPHLWGRPAGDISVVLAQGSDSDGAEAIHEAGEHGLDYSRLEEFLPVIKRCFLAGELFLNSAGALALYVVKNSAACRRYLKTRYLHAIVDEYQDVGAVQHALFLELHELGIVSIAVGDPDQSIFAFSEKSPEHLLSLVAEKAFKTFQVSYNHRCHPSITNYATLLLDKNYEPVEADELRVFYSRSTGGVEAIAATIDGCVAQLLEKFEIPCLGKVGILAKSNMTGSLVNGALESPHRLHVSTLLEEDFSRWSTLFAQLLYKAHDPKISAQELIDRCASPYIPGEDVRVARKKIKELTLSHAGALDAMIEIAKILLPTAENNRAIQLLEDTLLDPVTLAAFEPASADEIQIMSLHKSKGLEFDLVFHLDMYEWVFPSKRPGPGNDFDNPEFPNLEQDLNLHYVGITRARKCCVLCTSTSRVNYLGKTVTGRPSEFLGLKRNSKLRQPLAEIIE